MAPEAEGGGLEERKSTGSDSQALAGGLSWLVVFPQTERSLVQFLIRPQVPGAWAKSVSGTCDRPANDVSLLLFLPPFPLSKNKYNLLFLKKAKTSS